jgi:hypothetical protein
MAAPGGGITYHAKKTRDLLRAHDFEKPQGVCAFERHITVVGATLAAGDRFNARRRVHHLDQLQNALVYLLADDLHGGVACFSTWCSAPKAKRDQALIHSDDFEESVIVLEARGLECPADRIYDCPLCEAVIAVQGDIW